ncbi:MULTISPECIES: oligosaccharide flippase family protein [unclassified Facklamia]|uniref:lipopolysaccharide biosynthesis protein n=1 Tax=Aerococcaceae TaxID=186827 RepID=UPI0013B68E48|nr:MULTISPECIES: oligosaccharide flippase family protein [unclassified Facklamia]NEW63601.1 oligosaccharide flippase family protein [Facklamia sp. 252]NEW67072.1 oligosaccharide flippase family protein [Facklamia sp. 253]QQD66382.1 oligosaccharide flippase family protein [Aerococcaceae bacterium zg-252]
MKHFLKRLLGFSMGPIFGAIISFIQVPILSYFLAEAEYGRASLFQTLMVTLPNYIYIGLDQAYTREYQQHKNKRELLQQAALLPMIVGLLLFILMLFFSGDLSLWLFDNREYYYIVWYGGIWVLSTILERFFLLAIRMEEKAFEFSSFSMLLKINVFLLSMFYILIGWRDFKVIVYGLIFGQLLGDLVLYVRYRNYFDVSDFKIDWSLIKQMLKFGLPIMVAVSLTNSLSAVDNIFLKQFRTLEEVAIYSVAAKVMMVIGVIKGSFTSFWVPTAYRWYEEKKEMRYFQYISEAVLFILTGVFFGLLLFKGVVVMLFAERYQNIQYILGLMAFPQIMYTLSETTNLGIVFSRKTHFNILVSIASFVPSVVLNYLLTPSFGYKGAAVASFAAYTMFYFSRTYFSNKMGFKFPQLKATLSILIMAFAALLNLLDLPFIELYTLLLGLVALVVQWSTVRKTLDIRKNSSQWDFT